MSRHNVAFDPELWQAILLRSGQMCIPPTAYVRSCVMRALKDSGIEVPLAKAGPKDPEQQEIPLPVDSGITPDVYPGEEKDANRALSRQAATEGDPAPF